MWQSDAKRDQVRVALIGITALVLFGAATPWKKSEKPLTGEEAVTDIAEIISHVDVRLEGIGLVVGLDNTGRDAPPSWYRERLIDEMRKAGVENPNKLLTDPRLSMVIVHARIPTGTTRSDRIDVELELPPACGTTSLAGGYLIQCRLKEIMIAGGVPREGPEFALAQGPVMIGTEQKPDDPKVGRVLGGARVKNDSPFRLQIKENHRSGRTSQILENVVNRRFHQTEGVKQKGMATAKTDSYLELRVPQIYHHNHFRYFRVLKLLPVADSPELRAARMAAWGNELLDPSRTGIAALRLEGLGPTAIDTLKPALKSPNDQVKFFAAEALAYLNDPSGADVLAETAVKRPEFRAYALAALAAMDQPAARTKLVKLMEVAEIPVRYGAFTALRTLDENDPFLGRVRVLDEPEPEEGEEESMAMAISKSASTRRPSVEDPFKLYLVDCDGPPLVHIARTRRCEIVVFGRGQKLLTPVVLGTGPLLINAADGDEAIEISKIGTGKPGDQDEKLRASLELGDVIRQAANLGAKYPDVVMILQGAARQRNLSGPLVVDAVPGETPAYNEALLLGKDATKKDDELTRTSTESPKRSWLLRRFTRRASRPEESDDDSKSGPEKKNDAATKDSAKEPAPADSKKDDAVQRTGLTPAAKKPRLLERLFRRDNP